MTDQPEESASAKAAYVVILYGGPAEGYCTLNACPISVDGPFGTREAAGAYAVKLPPGLQPHVMTLSPPMP